MFPHRDSGFCYRPSSLSIKISSSPGSAPRGTNELAPVPAATAFRGCPKVSIGQTGWRANEIICVLKRICPPLSRNGWMRYLHDNIGFALGECLEILKTDARRRMVFPGFITAIPNKTKPEISVALFTRDDFVG